MGKTVITQDIERSTIDSRSGEVVQVTTQKTFTTKYESDKFYMTFVEFIAPFYQLKSNSLKNLLVYLCEHAEFNTGKVALTTAARKQTCEFLGISNNSLTNYLKKLKDANLISGKDGEFMINPQIFWKGDTVTRKKLLDTEEIKINFSLE